MLASPGVASLAYTDDTPKFTPDIGATVVATMHIAIHVAINLFFMVISPFVFYMREQSKRSDLWLQRLQMSVTPAFLRLTRYSNGCCDGFSPHFSSYWAHLVYNILPGTISFLIRPVRNVCGMSHSPEFSGTIHPTYYIVTITPILSTPMFYVNLKQASQRAQNFIFFAKKFLK